MTHQKRKIFPENEQSPATKGDIDELAQITAKNFTHLEGRIAHIEETMVTKEDLEDFATKADLENFATKDDLKNFATKNDLNQLGEHVDKLDEDVHDLSNVVDRIDRTQKTILEVLDENNQLLKGIRRLPERVARLERYVFHR